MTLLPRLLLAVTPSMNMVSFQDVLGFSRREHGTIGISFST